MQAPEFHRVQLLGGVCVAAQGKLCCVFLRAGVDALFPVESLAAGWYGMGWDGME